MICICAVFGKYLKTLLVNKWKKRRINGYVYDFLVDYESIDVDNILDIHQCFMKNMISNNVWIH